MWLIIILWTNSKLRVDYFSMDWSYRIYESPTACFLQYCAVFAAWRLWRCIPFLTHRFTCMVSNARQNSSLCASASIRCLRHVYSMNTNSIRSRTQSDRKPPVWTSTSRRMRARHSSRITPPYTRYTLSYASYSRQPIQHGAVAPSLVIALCWRFSCTSLFLWFSGIVSMCLLFSKPSTFVWWNIAE